MSVAIAIVSRGKVCMGADTFTAEHGSVEVKAEPKIGRNGRFLIAACGSGRYGQILRHVFAPPPRPRGQDLLNFMVRDFVDALQLTLEANDQDVETRREANAMALVAIGGRLFQIAPDLDVVEPRRGYAAIGSGSKFALGALAVIDRSLVDPLKRIEHALEATAEHCAWVRPPFNFAEI